MADFHWAPEGQSLEYRSVPLRISHVADSLDPGRHGPIHAPDYWIWRAGRNGRRCRTLRYVQSRHSRPPGDAQVLSSDHDPLYRFEQWQANLRILDVAEIKTVPYVPLSHPFVERLIGTVRREYLDRTLFWTTVDLENKLLEFRDYFNSYRPHHSLEGKTPDRREPRRVANLTSYRWQPHCRGLYQTPIAA